MSLRSEHEHLVIYIDTQVKQILSHDGEPTDILMALAHKMEDVRKLMYSASEDEKDQYCEGYDGFYLFMTLLEDLASAISKEILALQKYH